MLITLPLTPYHRKDEEIYFDECSQLRSTIEKNRKKVKNVFKTNVLVPKTKEKRRGRYRSGVSPTFSQRAALFFRRAVGISQNSGKGS